MIERRTKILDAAMKVAEDEGLSALRLEKIMQTAEMTRSLFYHEFASVAAVLDEVVNVAVADENLTIIADALTMRHPSVADIPRSLKAKALADLMGS